MSHRISVAIEVCILLIYSRHILSICSDLRSASSLWGKYTCAKIITPSSSTTLVFRLTSKKIAARLAMILIDLWNLMESNSHWTTWTIIFQFFSWVGQFNCPALLLPHFFPSQLFYILVYSLFPLRLGTIRHAQLIVVMKDGVAVEMGCHEALCTLKSSSCNTSRINCLAVQCNANGK